MSTLPVSLLAAALTAAAPAAPAPASPAAPPAWAGAVCARFVLATPDAAALEAELKDWGARPVPESEAGALRPVETGLPGQMFRLPGSDAPLLVLDRRGGRCALEFASGPPAGLEGEFASESLPVGDRQAPSAWRRLAPRAAPGPHPPRWFMKVGSEARTGLCGQLDAEVPLQDGRSASILTVSSCRISSSEAPDNG